MDKRKDDVEGALIDATHRFYNRMAKIYDAKTFKYGGPNFDYLYKTVLLFYLFADTFDFFSKKDFSKKALFTFFDAYRKIDFSSAKNDKFLISYLKKSHLMKGNAKDIKKALSNHLIKKDVSPLYLYICRMILIHRNSYSQADYDRDFNEIYTYKQSGYLIPGIRYSVIENHCSWGKEQRDNYRLKMELNPSYSKELIEEIFE